MHITKNSYKEVLAIAKAESKRRNEQLITATLCFGIAGLLVGYEIVTRLPPCPTEDSQWCTWSTKLESSDKENTYIFTWEGGPVWRYSK